MTLKEFEIEFTGWLTIEAETKDDAIADAETEINWCKCRFDITKCRGDSGQS